MERRSGAGRDHRLMYQHNPNTQAFQQRYVPQVNGAAMTDAPPPPQQIQQGGPGQDPRSSPMAQPQQASALPPHIQELVRAYARDEAQRVLEAISNEAFQENRRYMLEQRVIALNASQIITRNEARALLGLPVDSVAADPPKPAGRRANGKTRCAPAAPETPDGPDAG